MGCYFHGHECENTRRMNPPELRQRMNARRQRTEKRLEFLRENGYTVTVVYECQWIQDTDYEEAWQRFGGGFIPPFTKSINKSVTVKKLLDAVRSGNIFAMIECDIQVFYILFHFILFYFILVYVILVYVILFYFILFYISFHFISYFIFHISYFIFYFLFYFIFYILFNFILFYFILCHSVLLCILFEIMLFPYYSLTCHSVENTLVDGKFQIYYPM